MLTTHQDDTKLRVAQNLIPNAQGRMVTRPGANQVISGEITKAQPWGQRLLVQRAGRLILWDGVEHDVGPAVGTLRAASFQALTADAQRQDRLYVADGVNRLRYLVNNAGSYEWVDVVNTVLDENSAPFEIPTPHDVTVWRSRLWISFGTNRVQHCQNDDPAYWDPLWTVEAQDTNPGRVRSFKPFFDILMIGTDTGTWGISGTSQLNWERQQVAEGGVQSPDGFLVQDELLYRATRTGLFALGNSSPLTDDIRELFITTAYGPALSVDKRHRLLAVLVDGRLLAAHLDNPGRWGEMDVTVSGIIDFDGRLCWFGVDGLWLLSDQQVYYDSKPGVNHIAYSSTYETWPVQPNPTGGGRSVLHRAWIRALGDGAMSYTAINDEGDEYSDSLSFDVPAFETLADAQAKGTPPTHFEITPHQSGIAFVHRIQSNDALDIFEFKPAYT